MYLITLWSFEFTLLLVSVVFPLLFLPRPQSLQFVQ